MYKVFSWIAFGIKFIFQAIVGLICSVTGLGGAGLVLSGFGLILIAPLALGNHPMENPAPAIERIAYLMTACGTSSVGLIVMSVSFSVAAFFIGDGEEVAQVGGLK